MIKNGTLTQTEDGRLFVTEDLPGLKRSQSAAYVTGERYSGQYRWKSDEGYLTGMRSAGNTPVKSDFLPESDSSSLDKKCHTLRNEVLSRIVADINEEEFQRKYRKEYVSSAEIVNGWDARIREFAYAKSRVCSMEHVSQFLIPLVAQFRALVGSCDWEAVNCEQSLDKDVLTDLKCMAETICIWGGVPKADYRDTWKVVRSAVLGRRLNGAPMDSGWTKVASFATDGRENSQTIWDSRVSTSLVSRIDQHLSKEQFEDNCFPDLAIVKPEGKKGSGTRPRQLKHKWKELWRRKSCDWDAHFAGSALVRGIVNILNDPQIGYPPMPGIHKGEKQLIGPP